jgi:hypothetical protein
MERKALIETLSGQPACILPRGPEPDTITVKIYLAARPFPDKAGPEPEPEPEPWIVSNINKA